MAPTPTARDVCRHCGNEWRPGWERCRRCGATLRNRITAPVGANEVTDVSGLELDRRLIQLPDPIKSIGEHDVVVKLHREVTATLKIKVTPAG